MSRYRQFIGSQIRKDDYLVWQNTSNYVYGSTWWFLPSRITMLSGSNYFERLSNDGINIMWFIYKKGQPEYQNVGYGTGRDAIIQASQNYGRSRWIYRYFDGAEFCPAGSFWIQ